MEKLIKILREIAIKGSVFIFIVSMCGGFLAFFWRFGFQSVFNLGEINAIEFGSMAMFTAIVFGVFRLCKQGIE